MLLPVSKSVNQLISFVHLFAFLLIFVLVIRLSVLYNSPVSSVTPIVAATLPAALTLISYEEYECNPDNVMDVTETDFLVNPLFSDGRH